MKTLTVNINDKKTEKVVKAVLDALGLNYNEHKSNAVVGVPQTLEQYNTDIEEGNSEIEQGNFISATDLKAETTKW